jgi:hypothetical protein
VKNFLLQQYSGYEQNEEAIENAYDKVIMKSYSHRKQFKINLKTKLKKQVEESSSWVKALLGCFEVPAMEIISRTLLCIHALMCDNGFDTKLVTTMWSAL